MIQKNLLPIKLEKSDDEVTSRSGLILFDEFIKVFGLKRVVARYMPLPGSNRGFEAWRETHSQDSGQCGEIRPLHEDEAETSCPAA